MELELKDLVGEHVLSGVDFCTTKVEMWGEHFEDCEVVNFVLDGVTYTAIEDPNDGYRSCMEEIKVSDTPIINNFPGQRVVATMRPDEKYANNDILDLIDVVTGKVVLSIGTDNYDDYYPCWVAVFYPENMSINADR